MDTEKLNKVSKEDACENAWYPGNTSYESDIIAMQSSFSDTFKRGANWIMQQPLSEKLTKEEKEKIRGYYDNSGFNKFAKDMVNGVLLSIFGVDLFREK